MIIKFQKKLIQKTKIFINTLAIFIAITSLVVSWYVVYLNTKNLNLERQFKAIRILKDYGTLGGINILKQIYDDDEINALVEYDVYIKILDLFSDDKDVRSQAYLDIIRFHFHNNFANLTETLNKEIGLHFSSQKRLHENIQLREVCDAIIYRHLSKNPSKKEMEEIMKLTNIWWIHNHNK
ncbi:hypothetical protein [Leptospira alstonii]|uniref:hypothetical protein n=1 Tax=Leptospira alstonii TaxID=28452 RepID=UPI000773C178|nr:hypothetical protein [Leptospira alstonii]